MPVSMGSKGQADFSQPIELMMDCHRRIENFLAVLQRVLDKYAQVPLNREGHEALETSLNYFASAAPRHTEDEEDSLFPRMRESNDPKVREAFAMIDALEADHRKAEAAHEKVDAIGRRWLETGEIHISDYQTMKSLVHELTATYHAHIQIEDAQIFSIASRTLSDKALAEVGKEMKERRVQNPGREGSQCSKRRKQQLQA